MRMAARRALRMSSVAREAFFGDGLGAIGPATHGAGVPPRPRARLTGNER